ncbi:pentapeptide repeat-containing protein, partial [Motilimonas sp. E26]|uniref:pentapeptide repeat-containing protein n=1 Tax=Motilimonas sp. E26 TaxID=2865674 RepID=UPI001E494AD5
LLLAKQIITLYHAAQKSIAKDQHALEKCDLFENKWIGASLQWASFKESDLSRGSFSEDFWEQCQIQGCDLTHSELNGLDPRKVDLTGVKICSWQQEQLLEQLGVVVIPDKLL